MSDIVERKMDIIAARREYVLQSYNSAKAANYCSFKEGDVMATSEYIYQNQMEDANKIVDIFYKEDVRVVSVQKMTKVGADGLMIEIAKLMTSHNDDEFILNPANVRILTGMSNLKWENDMIDKAPTCFKDKIFHHGKLKKADLLNIKNSLIIIDEIDSGDKEGQELHKTLKDAGILDVNHMKDNNIRFLLISATMVKELHELYRWGKLHKTYKMSIPSSYIGHIDFLNKGLIQEFYSMNTTEKAEKWIEEDILGHYGSDFRVHIARVTKKNVDILQTACIRKGITFRNHNSDDRLSQEEINEFFVNTLNKHIVFGVKGFYRRANLIPNQWKLRIGATHELYKLTPNYSTEIQALPGRMSGYWRDVIENGHKTGPHRTSIKSITEYEKVYNDPLCENSYKTSAATPFLAPKHIRNLISDDVPDIPESKKIDIKKNVPIVLPMELTEIDRIHKLGTKLKRNALLDILITELRNLNKHDIADRIKTFEVGQITRPQEDGARKRNIDDTVNAALSNKPYTINVKDKTKDSWQAVFDDRNNRVVFMIYCAPSASAQSAEAVVV